MTTAYIRRRSEDRLAVRQTPGGLVVVVADGAGGMASGAEAADLALKIVAESIEFSDPSWLAERARSRRRDRSVRSCCR